MVPDTPAIKIYRAQLVQTGTNAPVAKEFQNNIGTIVWTRISEGHYQATLEGAFPSDKTFITTTLEWTTTAANSVYSSRFNNDIIDVNTFTGLGSTPTDILGTGVNITILVYKNYITQ